MLNNDAGFVRIALRPAINTIKLRIVIRLVSKDNRSELCEGNAGELRFYCTGGRLVIYAMENGFYREAIDRNVERISVKKQSESHP